MARSCWYIGGFFIIALATRAFCVLEPTFNRSQETVSIDSCTALRDSVALGDNLVYVLQKSIVCTTPVVVKNGQTVVIKSEAKDSYGIAVGKGFVDYTGNSSTSLLINAERGSLTLQGIIFTGGDLLNGVARGILNHGTLHVDLCTFNSFNFASAQDGGAIFSKTTTGASITVTGSTFLSNIAMSKGGAIVAHGPSTSLRVHNCTFSGNKAFGLGPDIQAGAGGSIYAGRDVVVHVSQSHFEAGVAVYGGGALFLCGGRIDDSTFTRNEANTAFGAVVSGAFPEEVGPCPALQVTRCLFDSNEAVLGNGGAIAVVESSFLLENSSITNNKGGGVYFGVSDWSGRDSIELVRTHFEYNEGSEFSPRVVGASVLLEVTNGSISTPPTAGPPPDASTTIDLGWWAEELFCFSNKPYECEVYWAGGGSLLVRKGDLRCNSCGGESFAFPYGRWEAGRFFSTSVSSSPTGSDDSFDDDASSEATPSPTTEEERVVGSSEDGMAGNLLSNTWVAAILAGALVVALIACVGVARWKVEDIRSSRVVPAPGHLMEDQNGIDGDIVEGKGNCSPASLSNFKQ